MEERVGLTRAIPGARATPALRAPKSAILPNTISQIRRERDSNPRRLLQAPSDFESVPL